MAPIPPSRPLLGDATKKILAMSVGGGVMMAVAARGKQGSTPPDADGTSFMRRDRAEAKEYYSGLGKAVFIPTIGALLCVTMLYGWPRGKMLDSAGVAALSTDATRAVRELSAPLAHSDRPAELLTFISGQHLRTLPREVRREVAAAALPADKRELLLTQLTYGLGGGGLFGGLLAAPVVFGDDKYDTRHFPKGADVRVTTENTP